MTSMKPWLAGLGAALFCLASAGTAADPQDDATKKELKALEGVWGLTSATDSSGDVTKMYGRLKYTFSKGKWRRDGDNVGGSGAVSLGVLKDLKTMDLIYDGDKGKEEFLYELKGDQLRLCFDDGMGKMAYPNDFKVDKDSFNVVLVFKRLK
ncbi:MAG TPA: TIGR03067 domain-containing protein [Gemmataceae bacterium]|nr:TIGR03067 domain-containing protein [Gemmataceae bacterium]